MSKRYVGIAGRKITLGQFVAAVKLAKAHPYDTFKRSFGSDWIPATGQEIVREFRRGMAERINSGLPRSAEWVPPPDVKYRPPEHYLWRRLKAHGRECAWCGQRFTPKALWDKCCGESCARAYGGF